MPQRPGVVARPTALVLAAVVLVGQSGCRGAARFWPEPAAREDAEASSAERAPRAASPPPSAFTERPSLVPEADAQGEALPTPDPMGGAWVTCYGHFRPKSTPERDVTRLGLLCGPANGMRLVGSTVTGEASETPGEHQFSARAGECFRVFAVAEPAVPDLAIEVRDPRGLPVGSDHNSDRFPIVNPDGPFCLFDAGAYKLRVHARKGRGQYALQLWRLP